MQKIDKIEKNISIGNLEAFALSVSNDITLALASLPDTSEIGFGYDFKRTLLNVIVKVLNNITATDKKVTIFYEVVPGFTLISMKRTQMSSVKKTSEKNSEFQVISEMMDKFFQKTGSKILLIESAELYLIFFPVSDLQKNLKELGFYYI